MANVSNPQDFFAYKLGIALQMERTVLTMLRELEGKASDEELKQLLSHHHDETEQQLANIEQAFSALGVKAEGHQSPSIDGLKTEGRELTEKVDESLVDSVIVGGAVGTEHHEIAVYESLITMAEAMGADDVVALLQENLEQEQHTLREVSRKAEQFSRQQAGAQTR
jgi:ferritin-like metal-binding protein YciE